MPRFISRFTHADPDRAQSFIEWERRAATPELALAEAAAIVIAEQADDPGWVASGVTNSDGDPVDVEGIGETAEALAALAPDKDA